MSWDSTESFLKELKTPELNYKNGTIKNRYIYVLICDTQNLLYLLINKTFTHKIIQNESTYWCDFLHQRIRQTQHLLTVNPIQCELTSIKIKVICYR